MNTRTWEQGFVTEKEQDHKKEEGVVKERVVVRGVITEGLESTKNSVGNSALLLGCLDITERIETCKYLLPGFNKKGDRFTNGIILANDHGVKDKRYLIIRPDVRINGEILPGVTVDNDPESTLFRVKTWTARQSLPALKELSNPVQERSYLEAILPCGVTRISGPEIRTVVSITKLKNDLVIWIDILIVVHHETTFCVVYNKDNGEQGIEAVSFDLVSNDWKTEYLEAFDPMLSLKMRFKAILPPPPPPDLPEVSPEKVTPFHSLSADDASLEPPAAIA